MKKKQLLSSTFVWLKDVGLKVFAILALVVGGFYVYAEITWPVIQPNPTTGVVGMFVGESSKAYSDVNDANNSNARGYDQVNALCANGAVDVANSHVCTPDEMVNSYNHGTIGVSAIFTYSASPNLWINSGPPGYTASANDCKGWTATSRGADSQDPNFGAMWIFGTKKIGGLSPCTTGKKFACCK